MWIGDEVRVRKEKKGGAGWVGAESGVRLPRGEPDADPTAYRTALAARTGHGPERQNAGNGIYFCVFYFCVNIPLSL